MEECSRCKYNESKFYCEQCLSLFCSLCDTYIHSMPSYFCHKRKFINEYQTNNNYNCNQKHNFLIN